MDAKILAKILANRFVKKILANRLSGVLEHVIHFDQTGFMPGKGTDIQPLRLFLNLSIPYDNCGQRVIVSLDGEKAFDSVDWLKILYSSSRARIRTNNRISGSFLLQRGTRQG